LAIRNRQQASITVMGYVFMYLIIAAIALVMLAPLGILVMYAVIALRQLAIANKECNVIKKQGAKKALLVSIGGMLLWILIGILIVCKM
jgi:hypothetical protein